MSGAVAINASRRGPEIDSSGVLVSGDHHRHGGSMHGADGCGVSAVITAPRVSATVTH
jgi:hypothetical protein